eukprot:375969_1
MSTAHQQVKSLLEQVDESEEYKENKILPEKEIVCVGTRLRIDQIASIDSKNQQYQLRGLLCFDWIASDDDINLYNKSPKDEFRPSYDIEPKFHNAVSVEIE